jgi:hypothetical protein
MKLTQEEREKIKNEFINTFAIKVTPNKQEDQIKAFLLGQFWKETTLTDMSDHWLSVIDTILEERREEIRKDIEAYDNRLPERTIDVKYKTVIRIAIDDILNIPSLNQEWSRDITDTDVAQGLKDILDND